jgi:hypothetical protein
LSQELCVRFQIGIFLAHRDHARISPCEFVTYTMCFCSSTSWRDRQSTPPRVLEVDAFRLLNDSAGTGPPDDPGPPPHAGHPPATITSCFSVSWHWSPWPVSWLFQPQPKRGRMGRAVKYSLIRLR